MKIAHPVYSLVSHPTRNEFLVGGGGGNGLSNALHQISKNTIKSSFNLTQKDDAVMAISIHPYHKIIAISSSNDTSHLRILALNNTLEDAIIKHEFTCCFEKYGDNYVKVLLFNSTGSLLLVGSSDGYLTAFTYPGFNKRTVNLHSQVLDLSILDSEIIVTTIDSIIQYNDSDQIEKGFTMSSQVLINSISCLVRFSRHYKTKYILICNSRQKQKSYLVHCTLNPLKIIQYTQTSSKNTVSLSIHDNLIALASQDYSIKVYLDFKCILYVDGLHSFPVTCLAFSFDGMVLASGSADGIVCFTKVEEKGNGWWYLILLILVVMVGMFLVGSTVVIEEL